MTRLGTYAGETILPGLKVSPHGSTITKMNVYTATVTPVAQSTLTTVELAVTVTGVLADDILVAVNAPAATVTGTALAGFRIAAANQVLLYFLNATAGNATAMSGTYTFVTLNYV